MGLCRYPAAGADDATPRRAFGGSLRSDVICCACGHASTSLEHFSHLSLDVPQPQQVRRGSGGREGSTGRVPCWLRGPEA